VAPENAVPAADVARLALAAALNRLGHALVSHDPEPAVLAEATAAVDRLVPEVEQGPPRDRDAVRLKLAAFAAPPPDGPEPFHYPDCALAGRANPFAVGVRLAREGDEGVARVRLRPAHEGPPGRAHGGIVAAVFDEVMGFVLKFVTTPAVTGELSVRYLRPTPLDAEVEFRARLAGRDGRKLFVEAGATAAGETVATAKATFVALER
jgi:acyl-coenzyme A thioesterase PaaI-like protein